MMFGLEAKEQKRDQSSQLDELELQIEVMEQESAAHLKELNLSFEEIESYMNNRDNFTEENWKLLQFNLERLEKKLESDLHAIKNPKETERAYENRNPAPHWIAMP